MCINLKVYLILQYIKVKKMFLWTVVTQDIPNLSLELIGPSDSTVTHLNESGVLLWLLHFYHFWYCSLRLSCFDHVSIVCSWQSLVSLNLFIWFLRIPISSSSDVIFLFLFFWETISFSNLFNYFLPGLKLLMIPLL